MVAVCVGYEYLSESLIAHQTHNLFHTLGIQLVEYVI
jgi:hypothetical protein